MYWAYGVPSRLDTVLSAEPVEIERSQFTEEEEKRLQYDFAIIGIRDAPNKDRFVIWTECEVQIWNTKVGGSFIVSDTGYV